MILLKGNIKRIKWEPWTMLVLDDSLQPNLTGRKMNFKQS